MRLYKLEVVNSEWLKLNRAQVFKRVLKLCIDEAVLLEVQHSCELQGDVQCVRLGLLTREAEVEDLLGVKRLDLYRCAKLSRV